MLAGATPQLAAHVVGGHRQSSARSHRARSTAQSSASARSPGSSAGSSSDNATATACPHGAAAPQPQPAVQAPVRKEAVSVEVAEEKKSPDDPYIETPRCTTCNECTQINDRMFAYNENKQAYVANPDAGSYAQLVEAAESCQVSIIHPGKPRNPAEPGLAELQARAEAFA